jgi:hypothetical protein
MPDITIVRREGEKLALNDHPTIPQFRRWRQTTRLAFRTMTGLGQVATDFIMRAEDFSIPMEALHCKDVRLMSGNDKLAEALCKTLKGEIARALSNELEKQARSGSPQFEGLQMLRFFYMEFEKEMERTQLLSMQTLLALRDAVLKDPPNEDRFEAFINSWSSMPLDQIAGGIQEQSILEILEECLEVIPCFRVYWDEHTLKPKSGRNYEGLLSRARDCLAVIKDRKFKKAQATLIQTQLRPRQEDAKGLLASGNNTDGQNNGPNDRRTVSDAEKKAIGDRDRKIALLATELRKNGLNVPKAEARKGSGKGKRSKKGGSRGNSPQEGLPEARGRNSSCFRIWN